MIKRTQGWRNAEEGLHQVIKQYSAGGQNDILVALMNVSAWILYHAGYRPGDRIDWFKRAIEEQINHIHTQEIKRATKITNSDLNNADFTDL